MTNLACHLREQPKAVRSYAGKRAFRLAETAPVALTCPVTLDQIQKVIEWMDVEHSARWIAARGQTHCNKYVTDLLLQLGQYAPNVWWTDAEKAFLTIRNTGPMLGTYGVDCRELTANELVGWMRDCGKLFGWMVQEQPFSGKYALRGGDLGVVIGRKARGHGHTQFLCELGASQAGTFNHKIT